MQKIYHPVNGSAISFDRCLKILDGYNKNMEDITESRRKNLNEIAEKYESQADLAKVLDMSPAYLNHLLSGYRNIGEKTANKIEDCLGLPRHALDYLEFLGFDASKLPPAHATNIETGPTLGGKVPLISWVQAGHAVEVVDLLHPGDGFEWIDTTCQIRRHTYALRVSGDSMTPDFPEGSILVVEPEIDPLPGDYVIAKNGDDEATFKQLVKDGADFYLKPLNERYPIKPLGDYRIIGVVRELVRRFR